jgi:hypothetical protein
MQHTLRVVSALAVSMAAAAAQAETVLAYPDTQYIYQYQPSEPPSPNPVPELTSLKPAVLDFSGSAVGALNAIKPSLSAQTGATLTETIKTNPITKVKSFTNISLGLSVGSVTFDAQTRAMSTLQLLGGLTINEASPNATTTGGTLSLSNLHVDYGLKTVYGSLTGGNGVGSFSDVALWTFSSLQGSTTVPEGPPVLTLAQATAACPPGPGFVLCVDNWWLQAGIPQKIDMSQFGQSLTGLRLTTEAADLWGRSLGLTDVGVGSINGVNGSATAWGTLNIGTVPEASTTALMLAGLGAMGLAAAKSRRAATRA